MLNNKGGIKIKNNLELFKSEEFGEIAILKIGGKEYFDANSIARALGYARPNDTIRNRCKGTIEHSTLKNSGGYPLKLIPEGDIYRLVIGSQLPNADKFESWIFDEILPSVRKHGAYMTDETLESALLSPDFLIQLATKLKEEKALREKVEKEKEILEIKIENDKPLVAFAEQIASSSDAIDLGDFAKLVNNENISIGRNRLFKLLRERKVLMENNRPYQKYINNGYFEVVEYTYKTPYGEKIGLKPLITPIGQIKLTEALRRGVKMEN